jgi:hypothetical protein
MTVNAKLEESSRGLIWGTITGVTEEIQENSVSNRCPIRGSAQAPTEYNSVAVTGLTGCEWLERIPV